MSINLKLNRTFWLEILIVMLVINYMVVTIILGDPPYLKYLRDVLLLCIAGGILCSGLVRTDKSMGWHLIFMLALLVGTVQTSGLSTVIKLLRKYIFPLLALFVAVRADLFSDMRRFLKFLLYFFAIVALWGVFQAQILGDDFLKQLGYPTEYSYLYKDMMLYNSYYFGGFGIQRVVSTISNSNVCALILGMVLIFLCVCYPMLNGMKGKNICILIMLLGYVLTFSRSNFLALIVVGVVLLYPHIPHKKVLVAAGVAMVIAAVIVGIAQGEDGLIYKLVQWVIKTLQFKESSAAGRPERWGAAMNAIKQNPLGIGFGHVGVMAPAGETEYYSCENSFFAVALDTGWIGFVSYYGFLGTALYKLWKCAKSLRRNNDQTGYRICFAGVVIGLYLAIVFMFSNHIYDMEAMTIFYILLGCGLGVYRKQMRNHMEERLVQSNCK